MHERDYECNTERGTYFLRLAVDVDVLVDVVIVGFASLTLQNFTLVANQYANLSLSVCVASWYTAVLPLLPTV